MTNSQTEVQGRATSREKGRLNGVGLKQETTGLPCQTARLLSGHCGCEVVYRTSTTVAEGS